MMMKMNVMEMLSAFKMKRAIITASLQVVYMPAMYLNYAFVPIYLTALLVPDRLR